MKYRKNIISVNKNCNKNMILIFFLFNMPYLLNSIELQKHLSGFKEKIHVE